LIHSFIVWMDVQTGNFHLFTGLYHDIVHDKIERVPGELNFLFFCRVSQKRVIFSNAGPDRKPGDSNDLHKEGSSSMSFSGIYFGFNLENLFNIEYH
jgi:hypothetical protein